MNKKLVIAYVSVTFIWLGVFFVCMLCVLKSPANKKPIVATETQNVAQTDDFVKSDAYINSDSIMNIMSTRIVKCGDDDFTFDEAYLIFSKIRYYAEKHQIPLKDALVIINIESDFKVDAYNKHGKAYGLCQVTKLCLDEYNWNHCNTSDFILDDMYDIDANLEVGFWYYNRILTHYSDYYGYITTSSPKKTIRDAYIAYNIGTTVFNSIGRDGRNMLRNGKFPINGYGYKKGEKYNPVFRLYEIMDNWDYDS